MARVKKPKGATRAPFAVETKVFRARDYFQRPFPLQIDRTVHRPEEFPPGVLRTREFWRISMVEKGQGIAVIGRHRMALKAGSVLLVHPDDPTTYELASPALTLINVLFQPELFGGSLGELTDHFPLFAFLQGKGLGEEERSIYQFTAMGDRLVPRLFADLLGEFHGRRPLGESLLKVRMAELLLRLGRLAQAKQSVLKRERLADFIDHLIEEHHTRDLSLEDFSDSLGMDKSHLGRVYRRSRGMTIFDGLHAFRLNRARELLTTTPWPIAAVAEHVGYPDARYFARKFRAQFGQTPAACRKKG